MCCSLRYLVGTAAILAALLCFACGGEVKEPPPPVVRPVKSMVVGEEIQARVAFPGTVQAADRSELAFRVSGPLIERPINEGEEMRRGQLLARIDPTDFEIALAEAEASYDKAEADYIRYQRLYEKDAVPQQDLELKRAMRDVALARLEQANTNLSYTYLFAPYSGLVGRLLVENFEVVQAQQPILTLQNISQVEIVVDVPEVIMARVRKGLQTEVHAEFDVDPDNDYPVIYKEVTAQADPVTQTFQVTFSMAQPKDLAVLPGMTAQIVARRTVSDLNQFVVPTEAVFADDAGRSHVWIIDSTSGQVSQRAVEVGTVTGTDGIIITDGLKAGETIAVAAVHRLNEGDEVRPVAAGRSILQ